jgi:hypothetical protein
MTLKMRDIALILFAPRGLITLSIPSEYRVSVINEEVITLVILFTLAFMMAGNFFPTKKQV